MCIDRLKFGCLESVLIRVDVPCKCVSDCDRSWVVPAKGSEYPAFECIASRQASADSTLVHPSSLCAWRFCLFYVVSGVVYDGAFSNFFSFFVFGPNATLSVCSVVVSAEAKGMCVFVTMSRAAGAPNRSRCPFHRTRIVSIVRFCVLERQQYEKRNSEVFVW